MPPNSDIGPEPGYQGPLGRTRTDHVRVFRPGREPLEVEVFRVVNVREHPELRAPALSGNLHELDDGEPLEIPFVYHDPTARHFALVIPDGARGRELSERARLIDGLMRETDDVPDYVRDFEVVYGPSGLSRHVEDAQWMEVDVDELEPIDRPAEAASYFPRLAGTLPFARFWRNTETDLAPLIDHQGLWLFARVDVGGDAFTESSSDLLVQLKWVEQIPVCLLTLRDSRFGIARRAFLDPAAGGDASILRLLSREYRATVVVVDEALRLLRSFRVEAPRAGNARLVLSRSERAPSCSPVLWERVVDVCRSTPPPIDGEPHPFTTDPEATRADEAALRLRLLAKWSTPERIDEALLGRSVPHPVFELSRRRIVSDAVRFGLALPNSLLAEAVRFGLASSPEALVESICQRFEEIVPQASEHGLDQDAVDANSTALRRLRAMYGTSTGSDLSCTMEHSG